jgi:hypothetical protein
MAGRGLAHLESFRRPARYGKHNMGREHGLGS